MKRAPAEFLIQRVLVALDASEHSMMALPAAAALAHSLGAEISGLFVEDEDLLRLADLPFARELRLPSGQERPLVPETLAAELRALAAHARQALSSAAARVNLKWSFQVLRGPVHKTLLSAARESDLLVLGWASRPAAGSPRPRLGSTARTALTEGRQSVLLYHPVGTGARAVFVAYEETAGAVSLAAERGLAAASHLAEAARLPLIVLLPTASAEETPALEERVGAWLREHEVSASVGRIAPDPRQLRAALQAAGDGVLVLPADSALLKGQDLASFLEELRCPLLLVR